MVNISSNSKELKLHKEFLALSYFIEEEEIPGLNIDNIDKLTISEFTLSFKNKEMIKNFIDLYGSGVNNSWSFGESYKVDFLIKNKIFNLLSLRSFEDKTLCLFLHKDLGLSKSRTMFLGSIDVEKNNETYDINITDEVNDLNNLITLFSEDKLGFKSTLNIDENILNITLVKNKKSILC